MTPVGRAGLDRDFPFYDGRPVRVGLMGWMIVLALTAAGFAALITLTAPPAGEAQRWVGVAFFVLAPLLGLRLAAGSGWRALFPRPTWRDVWIGVAAAPVALLVSLAAAFAVSKVSLAAANPAFALFSTLKGPDLFLFALSTLPQLLGEELLSIVVFLAIFSGLQHRMRTRRFAALAIATVCVALIFGALHLPTYQWHWVQSLATIGSARVVLLAPYLITKSAWSSTIAHILNDWAGFGLAILLANLDLT